MEINQTQAVDVRSKTIQELFNEMWIGLKSQGFKQSLGKVDKHGSETCMLRGSNGMKCAVGHIIPDELMNSCMEKMSAVACLIRNKWLEADPDQEWFMTRMQSLHDTNLHPEKMEWHIRNFAREQRLSIPGEN